MEAHPAERPAGARGRRLMYVPPLRAPVVVDCRNMYDRAKMQELGFRYDCYGA